MHYTLIVAVRDSEDLDYLMEPFGQEFRVAPHWGEPIRKKEVEDFCRYYKVNEKDFESAYKEHGEDWNGKCWKKDSKGVWREWITWNENAQWDWYEIGGRWPGKFELKEGVEGGGDVHFSWGWNPEDREKFLRENPRAVDMARKGDIANLESVTACSVLIDGEWIDVEADEEGNVPAWEYLKDLEDDVLLVSVDYHM